MRRLHARGELPQLALQALAVESELARGAADVPVALGEHPLDVLALAARERLAGAGGGGAEGLAPEDLEEVVDVHGLRQVVEGALLHRLHRGGDAAVAGEHDDARARRALEDERQRVETVLVAQAQVDDRVPVRERRQCAQRVEVGYAVDAPAALLELERERLREPGVVVDDEQRGRLPHRAPPPALSRATGSTMRAIAPPPSAASSSSVPPIVSVSWYAK